MSGIGALNACVAAKAAVSIGCVEMFKTQKYRDFSPNDWLTHMPPELVQEHLDISRATLAAIPNRNYAILPK